ncbi:Rha family transcriptional regulator [Bacillus pseudomycoides]
MNNLQVNKQGKANELYIDSLEVAEMTGKRHADLLRDIDNYKLILENAKLRSQGFFVESSYKTNGNNKTYKSYLLTRKGCDMVANKMTGEKGILFTASYIERFHEMESTIHQPQLPTTYKAALIQLVEQVEANEQLQSQLTEQAPKVEYTDKVLSAEGYYTATEAAKTLGMQSPQELYNKLVDKKIIYKSRKKNYLHKAEYSFLRDENYIRYQTTAFGLQMLFSENGRYWIAQQLGIITQ